MSQISIVDLEIFYRVGVPDAERAQPQRLLLTVEMESDFSPVAKSDGIADTIDYFAVSQRLPRPGHRGSCMDRKTAALGLRTLNGALRDEADRGLPSRAIAM